MAKSTTSFLSIASLPKLVKGLSPLAKRRIGKGRDKRSEELRRMGDTFGSPFELARYYVEPYCQDFNPAEHGEDNHPALATRAPVFATIDSFLREDYPLLANGSRQMFLLSDAGMGKTSLLMMIKLNQLMAFWPSGFDCLLLELGADTLKIVESHPNKANTVLLLDALDEDPLAWGGIEERVLALLAATTRYHRVLISCRTRFLPDTEPDPFGHPTRVRMGNFTCPVKFLSLFDDDQVAGYLAKRFPNRRRDKLRLRDNPTHQRADRLLKGMHSLRFRPLLLAYIDYITEAETRQWTPYTLYEALVGGWLGREERNLRRQLAHPPGRKTLWRICATVAFSLQQRDERLLSRAELDRLIRRFPAVANLKRFGVEGRSLLNRNTDGDLCFSHYSIQEFLVAHALVNGFVDPREASSRKSLQDGRIRVTDQLLAFLSASGKKDLDVDFALVRLDSQESFNRPIPGFHFYDRLSDGRPGPRMQWIPAGAFLMGSREEETQSEYDSDERPQHRVGFRAPFALGTYPVTFAEYDRFCVATDRKKPHDEGWGRGKRPVIDVSWQDAQDYCAWLSKQTGHDYYLPSEAQWEYAARAGTRTEYWWGDEIGSNRANCADCGSHWDDRQTAPVGSFAPNPFGLYETTGNVWEWTADCWHDNYRGAPVDGSPWLEGNGSRDCSRRVLRGGSWVSVPWRLRSAYRNRSDPDEAGSFFGFRLARRL
uniref:Formylglycine-generating enzyme, required for sulfatase activity, contains SUMF1/FGE domain n=1 Tax=Candidatus Kentrum sp. FM TaxID=2126340 RepID=A0A450SXZ2_9GAMM|nr:MAG: Formylglycine-generating enzyme, required for sulfatase activity, contains SUMF1/FGE domain [Candidatus Kentron sp. FM]VFJ58833.1 MAG: Formylglycine-generating enzyme, required for sulfatase activity, contains SUMF1/FGE domain [Candidatus Kentron sp. FM]VFK11836.1 MAG: Formylglycine-generating enzyme, required for sulfatase activity, contains SUMF1/FGE domain [Candidatus Kentron sp. FM]